MQSFNDQNKSTTPRFNRNFPAGGLCGATNPTESTIVLRCKPSQSKRAIRVASAPDEYDLLDHLG